VLTTIKDCSITIKVFNCSNTVKLKQNFWKFWFSGNSGVSKEISTVQMRLRLFKPLFKLFKLSESHISLNSYWVEVLKNREHLEKVVLKEAPSTHTYT